MVKNSLKKLISERLTQLCEQHGVTANLEVLDFFDDECDVRIPKELANEKGDALTEICKELEKCDGIDNIWDFNRDVRLRGDEYREFQIKVRDGFWERTKADEEREELEMRKYFDPEVSKQEEKSRLERKRKYWKEYLIPLPKPDDSKNTELYLTMAYEPYDWIKSGEKNTEFRAYNEYYSKKLLSHPIKTVKFQRGYGGPGRPKPEQMRFEVKGITLYDMESKMECDPFHPKEGIVPTFFAIELGKRIL